MESPDACVEFTRDSNGLVTLVAFKVYNNDVDGHNRCIMSELACLVMQSEGPEDHSTQVDVHVDVSIQ